MALPEAFSATRRLMRSSCSEHIMSAREFEASLGDTGELALLVHGFGLRPR